MKTTATLSTALLAIALTLATSACGGSNSAGANTAKVPSSITTTAPRSAPANDARPTRVVDKTIRINHGRMHLHCNGRGTSTVVLIAGWDSSGDESWSAVQPTIAARTRVCSYDRFGTGTSDRPSTPQTFTTEAADLRELLGKAREAGPYVVVGHSFGGSEAVEFAAQYREDVVSLMLIDASPTTWPAALCAVPDDGGPGARDYETTCRVFHDPQLDAERLDVFPAFHDVATIDSLGNLPMTVMTATERTLPGLSALELARLTTVWNAGVTSWARLSTTSNIISVEHTGHHIQGDRPGIVIDAITKLVPSAAGSER